MKSRQEQIESNLGLVHSCAQKFRNRGIEYDDLFQTGCIGLMKAVDGFDKERGFAFSTYAVPVILGEIKRLFRDGGAVKVSRALKEKARLVQKERELFIQRTGCEPTVGELSELMGLSSAEISELLLVSSPVVSLTEFFGDEEGGQREIPVESCENALTEALTLEECVSQLTENDRRIIELRFFASRTQSCVAEILGMTQVQVSRREKQILRDLREKMTV